MVDFKLKQIKDEQNNIWYHITFTPFYLDKDKNELFLLIPDNDYDVRFKLDNGTIIGYKIQSLGDFIMVRDVIHDVEKQLECENEV